MIKAINKIKKEVRESNTPHMKVIGRFVIKHLRAEPQFGKYVLQKEKSIAGAIQAMAEEAKKTQQNGVGMLTQKEGFDIVLDYFTRKEQPKPKPAPKPVPQAKPKPTKKKPTEGMKPLFEEGELE